MTPALVVHGGAGRIDDQRHDVCAQGCAAAARVGLEILARGGAALDAVQAAVRVLEDDPEFNAGVGAALTRDGTVELDASIMDGNGLRVGAVAAVPDLRQPIDLARAVLDDGEHALLAGDAAWQFGRSRGFAPAAPGTMIVARAQKQLEEETARRVASARALGSRLEGGGTVGACAIDRDGHVAAATSTGGMTYKRRGRVGDTPIIGAGTYADDDAGAASATGHGEAILRVTLTRFVVDRIRAGQNADTAAQAGIDELARRVRGTGGVICIDRAGRIGLAHNTTSMSWAKGEVGGTIACGAQVR
jgi:beta-aspartyl-peptidase (threonine type)